MKELSIEQKAQRYDEAIERAKCVIEQNPLMEYLKKGIEYIFPELAESKDERIRKELIKIVSKFQPEVWKELSSTLQSVFIAWLEKQGEQNPVEWSEEDEEMLSSLYTVVQNYFEDEQVLSNFCNWFATLKNKVISQSQWKPSDEQMKALEKACNKHWEPDGLDPLYTLYQDLKKLKG